MCLDGTPLEKSVASFIGTSIHRLSSQKANLQKLATRSLHAGNARNTAFRGCARTHKARRVCANRKAGRGLEPRPVEEGRALVGGVRSQWCNGCLGTQEEKENEKALPAAGSR